MTAEIRIQFSRCAPPTLAEMWRDKSFIDYSLWICRLTHSPFSHVDLVLDDGNLLGASNNPYAPVIAGNASGVAIRPPHYQRFSIRRIATIPASDEIKKKFHDFCLAQLGKPFDSGALKVGEFLSPDFSDRDWRDDVAWYCAEMIGRATEVSCLIPWCYPGIKGRLTPADYLNWAASRIDFDSFMKPIAGLTLDRGEI